MLLPFSPAWRLYTVLLAFALLVISISASPLAITNVDPKRLDSHKQFRVKVYAGRKNPKNSELYMAKTVPYTAHDQFCVFFGKFYGFQYSGPQKKAAHIEVPTIGIAVKKINYDVLTVLGEVYLSYDTKEDFEEGLRSLTTLQLKSPQAITDDFTYVAGVAAELGLDHEDGEWHKIYTEVMRLRAQEPKRHSPTY
ncbi:hypothetical protein GG344DRAFT_81874 [Lentinula edodes]|nr:hypothetical protein GG344DRAFT_81874 [Lentinula edodes]